MSDDWSPAGRVPPEIFSEIFIRTDAFININLIGQPKNRRSRSRYGTLRSLLLVCRQWYDTARSTKELWQRDILLDRDAFLDPSELLFRYLAYINPAWALNLTIEYWDDKEDFEDFLRGIMPRVAELNTGHLSLHPTWVIALPPGTNVQKLKHTPLSSVNVGPRAMIPSTNFPALQSLGLGSFLSIHTPSLSRLDSPTFEAPRLQELIYRRFCISASDFLAQCQVSPNLGKLELNQVLWHYPLNGGDHGTYVHLPSLHTLTLNLIGGGENGIAMPRAILANAPALNHLNITVGDAETRYRFGRFTSQSVTKITLIFGLAGLSKSSVEPRLDRMISWIATFPNLRSLHLTGYGGYSPLRLTHFLKALIHEPARHNPPLKKLQDLTLTGCAVQLGALGELSWMRSLGPYGGLTATSTQSPCLITTRYCRLYGGGKNSTKLKGPVPDMRSADWTKLHAALGGGDFIGWQDFRVPRQSKKPAVGAQSQRGPSLDVFADDSRDDYISSLFEET